MSAERSCEEITDRLVGGVRATDDAEIAAHLGSCLRCFRLASELREVGRLASDLKAAAAAPDPGEAFWASFPARVAAAAMPASRGAAAPSAWARLAAFLRRPLPAAAFVDWLRTAPWTST